VKLFFVCALVFALSGCSALESDLTNLCTKDGAGIAAIVGTTSALNTDLVAACGIVGVVVP
jgi:hypothetical protein